MTRCGHIFCLPCIIHYMKIADDEKEESKAVRGVQYKNCPICLDPVCMGDIRPVRWHTATDEPDAPIASGSRINFRLMKRTGKGTLSLPHGQSSSFALDTPVPWHFTPDAIDYARIMLGTRDYMDEHLDLDNAALEIQSEEDEMMYGDGNRPWVKLALESIKRSKSAIEGIGNWEDHPSASKEAEGESPLPPPSGQDPGPAPAHSYFFYQALLHNYLCPLDVRILLAAFGYYDKFPDKIAPLVEHVSTGWIVGPALRKRTRYLSHLPEGCEVSFLECDFTDIVPAEVLSQFSSELDARRRRHRERTERDDRRREHAEMVERQVQLSEMGTRRAPWAADQARPVVNDADFVPLRPSHPGGDGENEPRAGQIGVNGTTTTTTTNGSHPPRRTVWGTAAVPPARQSTVGTGGNGNANPDGFGSNYGDGGDGDGGIDHPAKAWTHGWDDGALAVAEVAAAAAAALDDADDDGGGNGKKKGKKRGRKITLLSTNVRRGA